MKYIMIEVDFGTRLKQFVPVIFPEVIDHDKMARDSLRNLRCGNFRHSMTATTKTTIRSAGFLVLNTLSCCGRSETLGLPAHEDDSEIIRNFDDDNGRFRW